MDTTKSLGNGRAVVYGVLHEEEGSLEYVSEGGAVRVPVLLPKRKSWSQHLVFGVGKFSGGSFESSVFLDAPNSTKRESHVVLGADGLGAVGVPEEGALVVTRNAHAGILLQLFCIKEGKRIDFDLPWGVFKAVELTVPEYSEELPKIFAVKEPPHPVLRDGGSYLVSGKAEQIGA